MKPTKGTINARILLTGFAGSYTVKLSGFNGQEDIPVSSTLVGNAIVRALRHEAWARPDLFPQQFAQGSK